MKTLVRKLKMYKPASEIFNSIYNKSNAVFLDSSLENKFGSIFDYCLQIHI